MLYKTRLSKNLWRQAAISTKCFGLPVWSSYSCEKTGCVILFPSPGLRSWALLLSQYILLGCCGWSGPRDSTFVSHLRLTRNKYAMDALGCTVPRFSPPLLPLLSTCFAVCRGCFEPHEPALLSHIRSRWSGPPESKLVSLVSHLSPTVSKYAVGALGRIILHLYRTCLWMLWAAWFCVCTLLVAHLFLTLRVLRATCDSALVSPFSPTLVARLPTAWLPLSRSTLWVLWAAWVYTCLPCSGCFEQPAPVS